MSDVSFIFDGDPAACGGYVGFARKKAKKAILTNRQKLYAFSDATVRIRTNGKRATAYITAGGFKWFCGLIDISLSGDYTDVQLRTFLAPSATSVKTIVNPSFYKINDDSVDSVVYSLFVEQSFTDGLAGITDDDSSTEPVTIFRTSESTDYSGFSSKTYIRPITYQPDTLRTFYVNDFWSRSYHWDGGVNWSFLYNASETPSAYLEYIQDGVRHQGIRLSNDPSYKTITAEIVGNGDLMYSAYTYDSSADTFVSHISKMKMSEYSSYLSGNLEWENVTRSTVVTYSGSTWDTELSQSIPFEYPAAFLTNSTSMQGYVLLHADPNLVNWASPMEIWLDTDLNGTFGYIGTLQIDDINNAGAFGYAIEGYMDVAGFVAKSDTELYLILRQYGAWGAISVAQTEVLVIKLVYNAETGWTANYNFYRGYRDFNQPDYVLPLTGVYSYVAGKQMILVTAQKDNTEPAYSGIEKVTKIEVVDLFTNAVTDISSKFNLDSVDKAFFGGISTVATVR